MVMSRTYYWSQSIMLISTTYNMVKASSLATRLLWKYIKYISFHKIRFYECRTCSIWNVGTSCSTASDTKENQRTVKWELITSGVKPGGRGRGGRAPAPARRLGARRSQVCFQGMAVWLYQGIAYPPSGETHGKEHSQMKKMGSPTPGVLHLEEILRNRVC